MPSYLLPMLFVVTAVLCWAASLWPNDRHGWIWRQFPDGRFGGNAALQISKFVVLRISALWFLLLALLILAVELAENAQLAEVARLAGAAS